MMNMIFIKNTGKDRNKCEYLNSKKGSYILEASITVPIFIIGVLLLSSIISIVSRCENANYILCDEAEKMMFVPIAGLGVEERIRADNRIDDVNCFEVPELNKTHRISLTSNIGPQSVFDIDSKVRFEEVLIYRDFTGAKRSSLPANDFGTNESYHAVYIFPNSGKKFHKKSCTYVNSYASRIKLTSEIKKKFRACRLCDSKNAQIGDMVYIFEYGDDYHLRHCPTIEKFVIEIDIDDARAKGYSPCSKCGG